MNTNPIFSDHPWWPSILRGRFESCSSQIENLQSGGANAEKLKSIDNEISKVQANNQGDPQWAEREIGRLRKAKMKLMHGEVAEVPMSERRYQR